MTAAEAISSVLRKTDKGTYKRLLDQNSSAIPVRMMIDRATGEVVPVAPDKRSPGFDWFVWCSSCEKVLKYRLTWEQAIAVLEMHRADFPGHPDKCIHIYLELIFSVFEG